MQTTELFRKQLGISQELMAIYLKLNRSQLAMYETRKRELPTVALVKLAEISVFLEQNKITALIEKEFLKKQELEDKAFLDHQIKELEYQKLKEERLLESMQMKFRQNLALYLFALHLKKSVGDLAEVFIAQANNGMKQYGLLNQTKHSVKIEGIKSQLDYFQSIIY